MSAHRHRNRRLRRHKNVVFVGTPDGGRLPITWGSIFWMTVFTTIGTVIGTWLYVKYAPALPTAIQPPVCSRCENMGVIE